MCSSNGRSSRAHAPSKPTRRPSSPPCGRPNAPVFFAKTRRPHLELEFELLNLLGENSGLKGKEALTPLSSSWTSHFECPWKIPARKIQNAIQIQNPIDRFYQSETVRTSIRSQEKISRTINRSHLSAAGRGRADGRTLPPRWRENGTCDACNTEQQRTIAVVSDLALPQQR